MEVAGFVVSRSASGPQLKYIFGFATKKPAQITRVKVEDITEKGTNRSGRRQRTEDWKESLEWTLSNYAGHFGNDAVDVRQSNNQNDFSRDGLDCGLGWPRARSTRHLSSLEQENVAPDGR